MKVVGEVNNIHPSTKPVRLKPGEVAIYRVLCGSVNPNDETRRIVPVQYPETWPLPNKDRIWDENKGEYVDIGVVSRIASVGGIPIPRFKKLIAYPKANSGLIYCTGGNVDDEEVYEFFELTDHNGSKKGRDESKTVIFERVVAEVESKNRNKRRSVLGSALNYAHNMTPGDIRKFAASQNWNEKLDIEVLRDKIGEFIETDPEGFVAAVEDTAQEVKALLKEAITAQVITFDPVGNRIVQKGQKTALITLTTDPEKYLDGAAEWIKTHKKGDSVFALIKKLLNANSNPGDASE